MISTTPHSAFGRAILLLIALLIVGCGSKENEPPKKGPAEDGKAKGPPIEAINDVTCLACSPDGRLVGVTYSNPGMVGVWDIQSGLANFEPNSGHFEQLVFTPDSLNLIGMGTPEKKMMIWNAKTGSGREVPLPPWKGGTRMSPFVTMSGDGKSAVSIYDEKKIVKLDVSGGKVDYFPNEIEYFRGAAYSPALHLVAIGQYYPSHLLLIKLGEKSPNKKIPLPLKPRAIAFSKDGKTMALSLSEEEDKKRIDRVELWDTDGWKVRGTLPKKPGPDFRSYEIMALSEDGKFLAGVPYPDERCVELWDTTGRLVNTIENGDTPRALAFTPDGKTLIIGYRKQGLKLVDTAGKGK